MLLTIITLILIILGSVLSFSILTLFLLRKRISANRSSTIKLKEGNMEVPAGRTINWKRSSVLNEALIEHFSSLPLPSWKKDGKVMAPRIALAKLHAEVDIDEVNRYLRSQSPWGAVGSKWFLNPSGDYDFTMMILVSILYGFSGRDRSLERSTSEHIVSKLLDVDIPLKDCTRVPSSFGMLMETENHILMITGSRYLYYKWAANNGMGGSPEVLSILEQRTMGILSDLENPGPYEFNSDPYIGFTLTALLNLEAYGSMKIRRKSRKVLDRLNYNYALSSLSLRRAPPFRRQVKRARKTSLVKDRHSSMMEVWASLIPGQDRDPIVGSGHEHAVMAALLPYRPADKVMSLLFNKKQEYLVQIGHGKGSSPEIYSAGPGFLISAGGVSRGSFSRIIARPTVILLDDEMAEMAKVIRLSGPGKDWWKWNNTGVHRRFAVAAGPVKVPRHWKPAEKSPLWEVFRRNGITIGVHSSENLGVVCIIDEEPKVALYALDHLNGDKGKLFHTFEFPGGRKLRYDVMSPKNKAVMISVDDEELDSDIDTWPLLSGVFYKRRKAKR